MKNADKKINIKEIVVISGKGGTGKTTVAASLADIIPDKIVVDADVDAANMHILMKPENIDETDFTGKSIARIDTEKCTGCDRCADLCRFNAVRVGNCYNTVDPYSCDGCGLCKLACPVNAVEMEEQVVGKWFTSQTEFGDFIFARLIPGAENSGDLVAKVKKQAKLAAKENDIDTLLIDGPPGIGCPVIASISGAHLALIVTEPTYSAISDLQRVLDLTRHFNVTTAVVINRFDINPDNTARIESFAAEKGIPVIARIPHSRCIMEEISQSRLPSRKCKSLAEPVETIYGYIKKTINNK
jgi:MinD superfamily P-loop ATPase